MEPTQLFYKNGFAQREFIESPSLHRANLLLQNIQKKQLKEGFELITKSKYESGFDLRPTPEKYDNSFVDLLFEQNIPSVLKEITGLDLTLGLIKIRINSPGIPYTGWHRDTNYYSGKLKGMLPPAINLHFYPNFNEKEEETLQVWPGTHHLMHSSFLLDRATVALKKGSMINTNNQAYIILDVSTIHRVLPTTYPNGSIRLMYSFCREFQLKDYGPEHADLHKLYKEKMSCLFQTIQ